MAAVFRVKSEFDGTLTNSFAMTIPASVVVGDFMLAVLVLGDGAAAPNSVPAGWTQLPNSNGWTYVYWKFAAAGDAGAVRTWGAVASSAWSGDILAWSGVSAVDASAVAYWPNTTLTTPVSAGASGHNGGLLVEVYAQNNTGSVTTNPTPAMTNRVLHTSGSPQRPHRVDERALTVTGTTAAETYNGGVTTAPWIIYSITLLTNTAPNAPTLTAPTAGATADLGAGATFTWTFSDPDAGDTQSSYALRRKISGAPAYEYWNAGTAAWQSTEVFNASGAGSVTFAAGKWTNGNTYQWSVATKDAQGVVGPYATDNTVVASNAPVTTATAPVGTVAGSTRPTVTWSYADADSDPQATYQVRIFTAAQYGAGGFDPSTSAATLDSGATTSASARSWVPTADLVNGTTYRAYVRSTQSGGLASAWSFVTFTISLATPNTPSLAVTPQPAQARVQIVVTGADAGPTFTFANTTAVVEASDDGGTTWAPIRATGSAGVPYLAGDTVTVYDYEAPPGAQRRYRARTVAVV